MLEFFVIAVFIVALVIIGCVFWTVRYMLVVLPEQQRGILYTYTPMIVNQVSLEYSIMNDEQKKQIAEEKIQDIFESSRIPLPSDEIINTAICSAIYRQKQEEAAIRLEELRDEITRMQVERSDTIGEMFLIEAPITPRTINTEGIERIGRT